MKQHRTAPAGKAALASTARPRKRPRSIFNMLVAGSLTASLAFAIPANALASVGGATSIADAWSAAAEEAAADKSIQASASASTSTSEGVTLDASDKLDLRERGVVTPVKLQNPWGTCWSFSIIAACETSLLSELGTTYEESGMDLSELQLAGSVYKAGGVPESVDSAQAGEGYQSTATNPNVGMDSGGFPSYGSSMFASGIGPLLEEEVPYRNKGEFASEDDDPIIVCKLVLNEIDEKTKTNKLDVAYLTEAKIAEIEKQIADEGDKCKYKAVEKVFYAGNYQDNDGTNIYTDWTVSDDLYTSSMYNLENGNVLPNTRILDKDGTCTGTDLAAVKTIQGELQKGRGVSVAFCADQSKPDQSSGQAKYINEKTWAHYTYDTQGPTHAVTIVGYDNGYSKENFGGGDASKQPEADGAWLVKNSWGADTEEFPNKNSWGSVEDGEHTGYFWLSYYDKSVCYFESYDFDVDVDEDETQYYIDQYDYLPETGTASINSETPVSAANIFTASSDVSLSTLSCATYAPNTKVSYEVYLLDDEAATPTDPEHATLVATLEDTYEFAGYHRSTFASADDWVAMRSGQRYSVVTTQQCQDSGLYYQGVSLNGNVKPTEAQVAKYREDKMVETNQKYYDMFYPGYLAQLKGKIDPDTGEVYTDEKAEQVADEQALKMVGEGLIALMVQSEVDLAVDAYENSYTVSVVNAGESWAGEMAAGADATQPTSQTTGWEDWTTAVKASVEKANDGEVVVDNAPVKAFAKVKSWATVEELARLEQAIAAADGALAGSVESADGSDVAQDATWMTAEKRTELSEALDNARATLALAGEDYENTLANTTPTSETVNAATDSLGFELQNGTKAAANTGKAAADTAKKTADTGDGGNDKLALQVALVVGALAALVAALAAARRAGGFGSDSSARRIEDVARTRE